MHCGCRSSSNERGGFFHFVRSILLINAQKAPISAKISSFGLIDFLTNFNLTKTEPDSTILLYKMPTGRLIFFKKELFL